MSLSYPNANANSSRQSARFTRWTLAALPAQGALAIDRRPPPALLAGRASGPQTFSWPPTRGALDQPVAALALAVVALAVAAMLAGALPLESWTAASRIFAAWPEAVRPSHTRAAPRLAVPAAPAVPSPTAVPPTPAPTWTPPRLTLDSIFGAPADLRGADPAQVRVLTVTGDVIPARSANATVVQRGDFLYPFRATAEYLRSGDLLFINLEAPLMAGCPVTRSGFTFCGDARHVEGLVFAGVGVAGLANNHLTNYGPTATQETIRLLERHGIAPAGLGRVAYKDVRGLTFAFLAFNGVGTPVDRAGITRQIAAARQQSGVVVVQFHWGKEYVSVPERAPGIAPDDPRELAKLAIDAGADLIIGNHPHWVQGVELYRDRLIAYAHGNFIFDQMWSRETRESVVGRYTFFGRQLVAAAYRPVLIEEYVQPRFVEGTDAARILERMAAASRTLAGMQPSPIPGR